MAIYDIDVSNKLMFCKDRETSYNSQEEKWHTGPCPKF